MMGLFSTDISTLLLIYELGKKNGKTPGDYCEEEFVYYMKLMPEKFTFLGKTEKDIDLLAGDMREAGLKVINLKEEERKKHNE